MYLLEFLDSNQKLIALKLFSSMKGVTMHTNGLISYNDLYHHNTKKKRRNFNCKKFLRVSKIV